LELNFGEKKDSSSNWCSWKSYQRDGDRRPASHGSANYEREEASNMNRDFGSRRSNLHQNREESDAMGASAARVSRRESQWKGSEYKSPRRGYKVKETDFKFSWKNSKN
jgi:hypothetical protein